MAFDPTKIGAGYQFREFIFNNVPTAPPTKLVDFNPYRVGILFSAMSSTWYLRPNGLPTTTIGFQCVNAQPDRWFLMNETGPFCQQAFWGLPNNVANAMYVLSIEWIPTTG